VIPTSPDVTAASATDSAQNGSAESPGAGSPDTRPGRTSGARWADPARPAQHRVAELVAVMTLEEKVAQLVGVWAGASQTGQDVAPAQHEMAEPLPAWDELVRHGLGQLTRVFGTAPVEPTLAAQALARTQQSIVTGSRLGIPALAHEECLSGFTAWQATVFPTPLAWGAAFDPELVGRVAAAIGSSLREVGVHQGLAPVLDVARDPRWGRTEETIGEDPYLVATIGAAYAAGLESAGIVSTLKHFAGYSASAAGRNLAPVAMGYRELADVFLPPFEAALRLGGARSVMHSYAAVDGVPPAADPHLLTGLLRETWGFTGTVVADYFGVSFLQTQQGVAGSKGEAAALALTAGVDVELPTVRCYGEPLLEQIRRGAVSEDLVDRAVERVLRQKAELGLLDADWAPAAPSAVDLDPPALRELASELAERSVVLLDRGEGRLPLADPRRIAVVGPCADEVRSLLGCYAFPSHVGVQHPEVPIGIEAPTLLDAVRQEWPEAEVTYALGCPVREVDRSAIADAVAVAASADVCVAVVGDIAGLFGRGTSGEGCDATDLRLPGVQQDLLDALLGAGVPVVLVVLSGRPYALGSVAGRLGGVVQAFFPGQLGAAAVSGVLSGRVNPSGRLPIQVPDGPGGQPAGYLQPALGQQFGGSGADPSALYPFGHGLSYTEFEYTDLRLTGTRPGSEAEAGETAEVETDGRIGVACTVRNVGGRTGTEVVQLYLHDPVAQVARPVRQLVGYLRVDLEPGRAADVRFDLHTDRLAYTGADLRRVVEAGAVDLLIGSSVREIRLRTRCELVGPDRFVGPDRVLTTPAVARLIS
jgi:beta-xylosidase